MYSVLTDIETRDNLYFDFLASMNVEWIGLSIGIHYDSYSDPVVRARNCPTGNFIDSGGFSSACAFYDEDIRSFVSRARARGFKVYMTLAFETSAWLDSINDPACGTPEYKMSRAFLGSPEFPEWLGAAQDCIPESEWWWNPSNELHEQKKATFFSTLTDVAVHYATIGEEEGVELYSLGTETDELFRTRLDGNFENHFRVELQALVDSVRSVYSGLLTYDQQIGSATTDSNKYIFDDLGLDVVGISAYFDLVDSPPNRIMSVAELEAAWVDAFEEQLVPIKELYPSKPIIFTEIGFVNGINTPFNHRLNEGELIGEPYDEDNPTEGMIQQQNIFESFYNVNAQYDDLVAGTFIWGQDYFPYNNGWGCDRVDWSLVCRPAKDTIANSYGDWIDKDIDRVFDWAEATFPDVFPAGPSSMEGLGYRFRFYPQSSTYLASQAGRVVVHNGTTWNLLDVGSVREFLDSASQRGF
ncbi:MAG: hypothetical protein R3332_13990 [Pseudohongiellaceae bacterium]|nr:hypothetical protein [Pseudohongiellaceae bacterium]